MMQRELFDPQRMQYIRDHFDELKDEISKHSRHDDETTLRQIKAFYSARKDITIGGKQYCESPVTYCQRRGQGRYFANHGNSLQGIARTVRQCVAKDLYYDMDIKNAVEMEANLFGVVNDTHDKKEGMGAFLEKRAANLTDF